MRDQNQDLSPDKVVMVTSKPNAKYLTLESIDVDDIIAVRPIDVYKTDEKGKPVVDNAKVELTYKDKNGLCHVVVSGREVTFNWFIKEYGNRFCKADTKGGHYVNSKMPFRVEHRKSGYVLVIYPPKPCAVDAFELPLRPDFDEHIRLEDHYINALIL